MLKLKLADYSNNSLSVYLVDGEFVRDNIFLDFTEGGNYLRYPFVPEGEIWIGGVHIIECQYILVHEVTEICYALENGLNLLNEEGYVQAHEKANEAEQAVRDAPNTVDEVLEEILEHYSSLLQQPQEEVIWQT